MKNKTILLIASSLLLLAVLLVLATAFVLLRETSSPTTEAPLGTLFPSGTGTIELIGGDRTRVASNDGASIEIRDITKDESTIADVVSPGNYIISGSLGYCLADGTCPETPNKTDRYSISFDEKAQSFTIALLAEPLKDVRLEAEASLQQSLDITKPEMCRLNYYLGTPYWVNEYFSGGNLGFSFCEGAVALP